MKTYFIATFIISLLVLTTSNLSFAQTNDEKEIRQLDQLEAASIQKGDTITLLKLWSKDFVCNNPYGYIVTPPQIIKFMKAGEIDYSRYERDIERITFTANLAIVMGKEVLMPQNKTPGAGKSITMRYTHVWIKTGKRLALNGQAGIQFLKLSIITILALANLIFIYAFTVFSKISRISLNNNDSGNRLMGDPFKKPGDKA